MLRALGFVALAALATACAPSQRETSAAGTTDPSGFLAFTARAPAPAEHWNVDVSLRAAPAGTYLLVAGDGPLAEPALVDDAVALSCARTGARSCPLANGRAIVALADVGPGGSAMLRAAFSRGAGAWFSVVRLGGDAGPAQVAVRVLSEAIGKGDHAQPFTLQMSPPLPGLKPDA